MSRTVLIFVIIFFFFCISIPSGAQASLSTLAITNLSNLTVVCALVPSDVSGSRHQVNCTALPLNVQRSYRAGVSSYTAIAAGDGFLCALASPPFSGKTTMRWWDLHQTRNNETEKPKRLYFGSYLSDLEAGGSHVCAIVGNSGKLGCWRWDEISFSNARNFGYTGIAVGDGFLCGLNQNQTIKCFGNNTNVVGKEPSGRYRIIAASRDYACGVKKSEFSLFCWGLRVGASEFSLFCWGLRTSVDCNVEGIEMDFRG